MVDSKSSLDGEKNRPMPVPIGVDNLHFKNDGEIMS